MALSAVLLPAPLGPMIPRMRPSSRCRLKLSSAIGRAERFPDAACFDHGHDSCCSFFCADWGWAESDFWPLAAFSNSSGVKPRR